MGYSIHITRSEKKIRLEEWKAAVERTDGVRLLSGDATFKNPLDGKTLVIPNRGGDAEFFCTDQGKWLPAFCWHPEEGEITFRGASEFQNPNSPIRIAATQLALFLGAQLVGDEGEVYE